MSLNPKWVPMKWQCGPAEIEQLRVDENRDPQFHQSALHWSDPSTLKLLRGSPINCLIVEWATGTPPIDQAQQKALKPLVQAGRKMGLDFVGHVAVKENLAEAVKAAREAGLAAVILDQLPLATELVLPFIVPYPNDNMQWSDVTEIYRATGTTWPGADMAAHDDASAIGGPTGVPTTKSNGWFSLMSREIAPGKTPWLDVDPPASAKIIPADQYCRVIADSRVYRSHWVVSLDPWLRIALFDRTPYALETWSRIQQQIAFFEQHASWTAYAPMGVLGVVSDFVGLNALSSGDLLNFLNGSQTQFLAFDRLRMQGPPAPGLKGIVWMDDAKPDSAQQQHLLQFVRAGGIVIATKYWGPPGVSPVEEDWIPEYAIYPLEQGRIVVSKTGLLDPYQVSQYAHLLIGFRHDFARLFNPQMTNCYATVHPEGDRQVVQLVNYGPKPVDYMSVWINAKAKSARLLSTEIKSSQDLQCFPSGAGTEFHLPRLAVHCAIEIERQA